MDKRTVASAHTRIDGLDTRVTKVEVQLEERWKETILRIKRIESILIGSAGAIILLLVTMLYKL
jgi:hypothetical protein